MAGMKIDLSLYKKSIPKFNAEVKAAVETVAKNNPCRIRLKLDTTKGQASNLQRQISTAVNEAAQDRPFKIKTLTVDNIDIHKAIGNLQSKLDNSPMKLTIGRIDADSAVKTLRNDLIKMLKGLRIEGVGEFINSFDGDAGLRDAIDSTERLVQGQAAARKETQLTEQALAQLASAQKTLNAAEEKARKLKDGKASKEILDLAAIIRQGLADASGGVGQGLFDGINQQAQEAVSLLQLVNEELERVEGSSDAVRKKRLGQMQTDVDRIIRDAMKNGDAQTVSRAQSISDNITRALGRLDDENSFAAVSVALQRLQRDMADASGEAEKLETLNQKFQKIKDTVQDMPDKWADFKNSGNSGLANLTSALDAEYDALQKALKAVDDASGSDAKKAALDNAQKRLDAMRKTYSEASKLESALNALNNAPITLWDQLAKVKDDASFSWLKGEVESFIEALSGLNNITDFDQLQAAVANLKVGFDDLRSRISDFIALDTLKSKASAFNDVIESLRKQGFNVSDLADKYNTLKVAIDNAYSSNSAAARAQFTAQGQNESRNLDVLLDKYQRIAKIRETIDNLEVDDPSLFKTYGKTLNDLRTQLGNIDIDEAGLKEIEKILDRISKFSSKGGGKKAGFWETLSDSFDQFSAFKLVDRAIDSAADKVFEMFDAVRELDAAMTELRKVTELTEIEYRNFYKTASQLSGQVGATISDTINATADFARVGYTVGEATQLAEAAIVYKNVGDGIQSITQASESMISTMKAFNLEVSDAQHVIDAFNQVGNNFAVSSTGIGDALQRSAAALAAAGNTMEESIGLITGMNTILQNPESVGTTLKTLTMYLRAAKTEAEDAGIATDGMADSVSQLRDNLLALTGGRVDIMLDDSTFKSTYDIMQDIAKVWDSLSDVTQSNILNQIGGKRNSNAIAALISNFQEAEKAANSAVNSFGSAAEENEKYLDSINGKITEIKASFEALSGSILNSTAIKGLLDIGNIGLDSLKWLSDLNLLLPAVISLMSIISTGKELNEQGSSFFKAISEAGNGAKSVNLLKKALDKLKVSVVSVVSNIGKLPAAIGVAIDKMSSMHAALLGLSLAFAAGVAVLKFAGSFYDTNAEKVEKARNLTEEYNERQKQNENDIETLKNLKSRYNELRNGVDEYGQNVKLTTSEYEEYLGIVNKVVQICPDMVKGINDERQAYLHLGDAIQGAIDNKQSYAKTSEDAYYSDPTVVKGAQSAYLDEWNEINSWDGHKAEIENLALIVSSHFKSNKEALDKMLSDIGLLKEKELKTSKGLEAIIKNRSTFLTHIKDVLPEDTYTYVNGIIDTLSTDVEKLDAARHSYGTIMLEHIRFTYDDDSLGNYIDIDSLTDDLEQVLSDELAVQFNPKLQWYDNTNAAVDFADEFVKFYEDQKESLSLFGSEAKWLEIRGSEDDVKAYNQKIKEWADSLKENSEYSDTIIDSFAGWLMTQNNYANNTVDAINRVNEAVLTTSNTVAQATDSLIKGYDAYKKAMEDMADGDGLSLETISSLQSALGDNGNVAEFLSVENGLLKFNADLWLERSKKKAQDSVTEASNHIDMLEGEIKLLEKLQNTNVYNDDKTRNDAKTEELKEYISTLKELGIVNGNVDKTFASLDEQEKGIVRKIDDRIDVYYKVTKGIDGSPLSYATIGNIGDVDAQYGGNFVLNVMTLDEKGNKFDIKTYVPELVKKAEQLMRENASLSFMDAIFQADIDGVSIDDKLIRGAVVNVMNVAESAMDEQLSAGRLNQAIGLVLQTAWTDNPIDSIYLEKQLESLDLSLEEAKKIKEIYDTILIKDLEDPFSLEKSSSNMQTIRGDVEDLLKMQNELNSGEALSDAEFSNLLLKYPEIMQQVAAYQAEGYQGIELQKLALAKLIELREKEYKQIIENQKAEILKQRTENDVVAKALFSPEFKNIPKEDREILFAFQFGDFSKLEDVQRILNDETISIENSAEYWNQIWDTLVNIGSQGFDGLLPEEEVETEATLVADALEKVTKAYADLGTVQSKLTGEQGSETAVLTHDEFLPLLEQYNISTDAYHFEDANIVIDDWNKVKDSIENYAATASKVGENTALSSQVLAAGKSAAETAASVEKLEETQSGLSSILSLIDSIKSEFAEDGGISAETLGSLIDIFGEDAIKDIVGNQEEITQLLYLHVDGLIDELPPLYGQIWEAIIAKSKEGVSDFQQTLDLYGKVSGLEGLMETVRDAEKPIDAIAAAMEFVGEADWDPERFIKADGTLDVDNVIEWTKWSIRASDASDEVKRSLIAMADASKEALEMPESAVIAEAMEKMTDVYTDLDNIRSKVHSDGKAIISQEEFLPLLSSYEIPKDAFHFEDGNVVIDDMNALTAAFTAVAMEASTIAEDDALTRWLQTIGIEAVKSAIAVNKLNESNEQLSSILSLMETIRSEFESQGFLSADTLTRIQSVFGSEMSDNTLALLAGNAVGLLDMLESKAIQIAGTLPAAHRDAWTKSIAETRKGISQYQQIMDMSGKVSVFESIMTSIKEADQPLDAIIEAMEYIGESDWDPERFIVDGEINVEALAEYAKAAIEASDMSQSLKDSMIEAIEVAADMSSTFESVAESIEQTISNVTSAISGLSSVGSGHQLTFDQFKELMSISEDYMEALEYQNGMLTLSTEKYVEVTESIAEAAIAEAEEKAALIELSDEYQYLIGLTDELSSADQNRLNDLQMQINGFRTLASQIQSATSALARFAAMDISAEDNMFSSVQEAFELIKNVEQNTDSEFYGQFGNEGYQAAIKALIPFDRGTKEYEASMKRLTKYFDTEHPLQGINNFAGDLETAAKSLGLYNEATGEITGDTATFAKALGITEEAFRGLLRQTNLYIANADQQFKIQDMNLESAKELYGKEATHETVIEYALHPKFDVEDPEKVEGYEEAKERMEKYLEEGGEKDFAFDLHHQGLIDENGNLLQSLDVVAEKLGLSKDMVIDLIDAWNNGKWRTPEVNPPKITADGTNEKVNPLVDPKADLGSKYDASEYVLGEDYINEIKSAGATMEQVIGDASAKVGEYLGGTPIENAEKLRKKLEETGNLENGKLTTSISEAADDLNVSTEFLQDQIDKANELGKDDLKINVSEEQKAGATPEESDIGTLETIQQQIADIQLKWAEVSKFDIDVSAASLALATIAGDIANLGTALSGVSVSPEFAATMTSIAQLATVLGTLELGGVGGRRGGMVMGDPYIDRLKGKDREALLMKATIEPAEIKPEDVVGEFDLTNSPIASSLTEYINLFTQTMVQNLSLISQTDMSQGLLATSLTQIITTFESDFRAALSDIKSISFDDSTLNASIQRMIEKLNTLREGLGLTPIGGGTPPGGMPQPGASTGETGISPNGENGEVITVDGPDLNSGDLTDGIEEAKEQAEDYADTWSEVGDSVEESAGDQSKEAVEELTDTVGELNDAETEDLTDSLEETGDITEEAGEGAEKLEKTVKDIDGMEPEVTMPKELTEVEDADMGAAGEALEQVGALNAELATAQQAEQNLTPMSIDASPAMSNLQSLVDKLNEIKELIESINSMSINFSATVSKGGKSKAKGSVAAKGNSKYGVAYARGAIHAMGGRTLVGELGTETVVDPHHYRYYTVGEMGAEFVDLPKDAIVFNAAQTEQLFKNGSTPSRGMAMAEGNAYAYSTSGSLSSIIKYTASGGGSSGRGSSNRRSSRKSSEKEEDPFKDTLEKYEELIKTTEHLIEHQEHLYEVSENALSFNGMAESLSEQAHLYKQIMADAQAGIDALKKQGATDADEALQKLEEAYWDAYKDLYDIYDDLNELYTDALKDKIDALTDGYESLIDASEELSSSGMISMDTLTDILDNGLQYLSLLDKVGDSYVLNQEKLQDMMAAEKEQLAIQSALAYVNQLSVAAADKSANAIQNLIDATNKVGDSTWNIVYAEAEALKNLGLTEDQYKQIIANIDKMRDLADQTAMDMADATSDLYSKQREAIDYILEKTKELIEYETEEQIEALEEQIDAFEEIIDKKRESLELTKDEDDYTKSVAEQTKEIAKMQAKIDQLSLDDSREAQAERSKLLEELKELQDKLAEEQADHSHQLQLDALDKEAEEFEKRKEEEIKTLEETISSEEKLYQAAIERIKSGWDTLYKELIDWNYEAGNVLNEEITENWEIALKAAEKYGSYLEALEAYKEGHGVDITLGTDASSLPHYHSGGIVDDRGAINSKEVLAVLKKGELVLDRDGKKGVYQIVDFAQELGKKLGIVVGELTTPLSNITRSVSSVDTKKLVSANGKHDGDVFSPTFHVAIEHNGTMTDHDAQKYGEQIATTAIDKLYNAFKSRGISEVTTRLRTV